ncbi:MAG TPA: transcriptional regulator, partial [Paracoccus sp.]|nr:transcriptional regulator [Paracoccus sp. (in: a-proteobacteria)]
TLGVAIGFFFEGLERGGSAVPEADLLANKEAMELVRAYYAIPEAQRKRLFDLAQVLSAAA